MKFLGIFLFAISLNYSFGQQADTNLIASYFKTICKTEVFRTYENVEQLNKTADYLKSVFQKYADTVYFQEYQVSGKTYKNVIALFGEKFTERVVVGAHYDVCDEQEGADDNASGVVGLLELARMLHQKKLNKCIELVAYTLEEPPFFRTEHMGSYVHAKSLADAKIKVTGMLSLEMIGYFKEEKHTQDYPVGILSLIYGKRGNYITLVKKFGAGKFARKFSRKYKHGKSIKTKRFVGPAALPGIDFSDHLNYWKFGYSALMLTDTAFYRNKNYHQVTDKVETLDIPKMAKVIDGVYATLLKMC